jgi:hypothetical protein
MTDYPAEVDGWADSGYLPGHLPLEGSTAIAGEEARSLDAALVRQPPFRFDLGAQARHARQTGDQIPHGADGEGDLDIDVRDHR